MDKNREKLALALNRQSLEITYRSPSTYDPMIGWTGQRCRRVYLSPEIRHARLAVSHTPRGIGRRDEETEKEKKDHLVISRRSSFIRAPRVHDSFSNADESFERYHCGCIYAPLCALISAEYTVLIRIWFDSMSPGQIHVITSIDLRRFM